ncbi:hypothetical protein C2E23DRAFT_168511 [Lenzites betulinus]|nr:hypothetical protein C2E23DRAFT_168511 [Lenzites betulinus]
MGGMITFVYVCLLQHVGVVLIHTMILADTDRPPVSRQDICRLESIRQETSDLSIVVDAQHDDIYYRVHRQSRASVSKDSQYTCPCLAAVYDHLLERIRQHIKQTHAFSPVRGNAKPPRSRAAA